MANASIAVHLVTDRVAPIARINIMSILKTRINVFTVGHLAAEVAVHTVLQKNINTGVEIINVGGAGQQVAGVDVRTIPTKFTKNK